MPKEEKYKQIQVAWQLYDTVPGGDPDGTWIQADGIDSGLFQILLNGMAVDEDGSEG